MPNIFFADSVLRLISSSERVIAQVNRKLHPDIETIFLLTAPEHSFISSSIVREVLANGGDPSPFLPHRLDIYKYLKNTEK